MYKSLQELFVCKLSLFVLCSFYSLLSLWSYICTPKLIIVEVSSGPSGSLQPLATNSTEEHNDLYDDL